MADEEKKDEAAPAAAPVEGAPAGAAKPSFVQKLLQPPLVIILSVVIGVGAAVAVMKFMGKAPAAAQEEVAPEEGAKEEAHGKAKEDGHGKPKEAAHGEEGEKAADAGHGKPKEAEAVEKAAHGAAEKVHGEKAPADAHGGSAEGSGNAMKLEPFVVNIMEKNSIHYLKLTFEVECDNSAVLDEIKLKTPQLRDTLLYIVSDMTMREIVTMGGKTLLKEEIITHFNKQLKNGKIERLFFTDFTIQ